MIVIFKKALPDDAAIAGQLVFELTQEICERTHTQHFDIDLPGTIERCRDLLAKGHYSVILGYADDKPVAVATISETYALYAAGKIGVIQEFYVQPSYRSAGLGAQLIEAVRAHGKQQEWSCMELCTPPLPEFERTLAFYQRQGLAPVGGRKMRVALSAE